MRSRATGWRRGDARRQDGQTDCQMQGDLFERTKLWNLLTKWFPFFPLQYSVSHLFHDFPFRLLLWYSFRLFLCLSLCPSVCFSPPHPVSFFKCLKWRNSVVPNKISHRQDDKNSNTYDVSLQEWRQNLPAALGKYDFWLCLELFHNFFQRLLLCRVGRKVYCGR